MSPAAEADLGWAADLNLPFGRLLDLTRSLTDPTVHLPEELGSRSLNLLLVLGGLGQLIADHRRPSVVGIRGRGRGRRLFAAGAALANAGSLAAARSHSPLEAAEEDVWELATLAAAHSLGLGDGPEPARLAKLRERRYPVQLMRQRIKMPHCFRDLDVWPEDMVALARGLAAQSPAEGFLVLGVRTSGCYLAPAAAAALRALGRSATVQTYRPGTIRLPAERAAAARLARAGAGVLVVDDGVWWGGAMRSAQAAMLADGFTVGAIHLGICRFPGQPAFQEDLDNATAARVWPGLREAPQVVVEEGTWTAELRLRGGALEQVLNTPRFLRELGGDRVSVGTIDVLPPAGPHDGVVGSPQRRSHVKARVEVDVHTAGRRSRRALLVKAVGPGFFGYHSLLVGRRMQPLVPRVYGLEGGLLVTDWVEGRTLASSAEAVPIGEIARYIRERRRRLPLPAASGPAPRRAYSGAQRAARVLARGAGPSAGLVQLRERPRIERIVTAAGERSVIDGQMGPREWVIDSDGRLVKVDFEEHAFDAGELAVDDWMHDVADAGLGFGLGVREIDRLVELAGGWGPAGRERLLIHSLEIGVRRLDASRELIRDLRSTEDRDAYASSYAALQATLTALVNDYLLGRPVAVQRAGDIWSLDLDGTLETSELGFPALTPATAAALRALHAHGALLVLNSGRGIAAVAAACAQLGAAGGVAEYGAVVWDAQAGRAISLVPEEQAQKLQAVAAAARRSGLFVLPGYTGAVRVFRADLAGMHGVSPDEVAHLLGPDLIAGLTIIEGAQATDIAVAGHDKGTGLVALLNRLGLDGRDVHAMGDAWPDLPMLRAARFRYAPGSAGPEVRAAARALGIRVSRHRGPAGTLELVDRALHGGHACAACRRKEEAEPWSRTLLEALAMPDWGRVRRLRHILHPSLVPAVVTALQQR